MLRRPPRELLRATIAIAGLTAVVAGLALATAATTPPAARAGTDPAAVASPTPVSAPSLKPVGDGPWPPEPPPPPPPQWKIIGWSVRGRPIKAIVFGDGERMVVVVAGVHGNESGTPVAKAFVRWLFAHPGAVPDDAQIHVVRCLNPDGAWAGTRGNARNVDLNRNFPAASWSRHLDPADPSAMMGLTGGTRPASEPETRALVRYLKQGFDVVVGLHSRAGLVDWDGPGGRRLARRMSRLCGLPLGHVGYQSHIHGSLGQYFPERYGKPTVTIELLSSTLTRGLRLALLSAARP
jgi:murein peptide amidase A